MGYGFAKDSNYVPMYGPAGQESYTFISSTGTGDLAWRSSANYAALTNSEYGFQNSNQMQATEDHYIFHSLGISENEVASIAVDANGTTQITDMCDSTWVSSYSFGKGCGCYTNANVNTVGSGSFNLLAKADNQITTDSGITVNGGSLNIRSDFANGFHFSNFALSGN
jgi:hypothetical protein